MRKEKSRDAARSRRGKENHEFYQLAALLPLPAAITSQLDFLDKASIIRLTISFLKLRQFSVNGHPPWSTSFTTLASVNPYSDVNNTNNLINHRSSSSASSSSLINNNTNTTTTNNNNNSNNSNNNNNNSNNSNNNNNNNNGNNQIMLPSSSTLSSSHQAQQQQQQQQQNINSSLQLSHCQQSSSSTSTTNDLSTIVAPFSTTTLASSGLHCLNPLVTGDPTIGILSPKLYSRSAADLFELHQGTHMLHSLDGFVFAIGRDGRFLYISETVSIYLGLSQVEMTGSSVFDYTHHQDHQELANQLGIPFPPTRVGSYPAQSFSPSLPPASVQSQCSAASSETTIDDHVNPPRSSNSKRAQSSKGSLAKQTSHQNSKLSSGRKGAMQQGNKSSSSKKSTKSNNNNNSNDTNNSATEQVSDLEQQQQQHHNQTTSSYRKDINCQQQQAKGTLADPLVRQFCIRMKSTLTKRGCQHFKSSGYRVVHVVSHLRTYQSNDHGHLMDPYDEVDESSDTEQQLTFSTQQKQNKKTGNNSDTKQSSLTKQEDDGHNNNNSRLTLAEHSKKSLIDHDKNPIEPIKKGKPLKIIGMVAVAIALPPPSINELPLQADTFVLRLSLDLKITHAEARVSEVLHHPLDQLTGRSLYSLVHPADLCQVHKCHQDLMQKGQMMSGYYRLLGKSGGYLWVQTCATLICNNTMSGVLGPPPIAAHSPLISNAAKYSLDSRGTCSSSGSLELPASFGSHINPKMSPSATSHFSSNFDQQEQDQCIIFVNHMIGNLTNEGDILDICQSANYSPMLPLAAMTSNSMTTTSGHHQHQTLLLNSASPSSCSSPLIGYTNNQQQQQRATFLNSPSTTYTLAAAAAPTTPTTSTTGAIVIGSPTKHNNRQAMSSTSEQIIGTRRLTGAHKNQHQKKDRTISTRTASQQQQQQQLGTTITTLEVNKGNSKTSEILQDDIGYNNSSSLLSSRLTNFDTLPYSGTTGHSQTLGHYSNNSNVSNLSVFTTPPIYKSPAQSSGVSYSNNNNVNSHHNQQQQQQQHHHQSTMNNISVNSLSSSNSSSSSSTTNNGSACDNNNHLISSAIHLYNTSNTALDSHNINNNDDNEDNMQQQQQQQQHQDQQNGQLDGDGPGGNSNEAYKRRKCANVSPLRPWRESSGAPTSNNSNCLPQTALGMSHNHHNDTTTMENQSLPYLTSHGNSAAFMDNGSASLSDHHHLTGYASTGGSVSNAANNSTNSTAMFNAYGSSAAHKGSTIYQHHNTTTQGTTSPTSSVLLRHMGVLPRTDGTYCELKTASDVGSYVLPGHHAQASITGQQHHTGQYQIGHSSSTGAYLGGHNSAVGAGASGAVAGSNHNSYYHHPLVDPYHHHHHLYKNGSLHHHHHNHHHQSAAVAAAAAAAALAVNSQHPSAASIVPTVGMNSSTNSLNHHHHHTATMTHPYGHHSYN